MCLISMPLRLYQAVCFTRYLYQLDAEKTKGIFLLENTFYLGVIFLITVLAHTSFQGLFFYGFFKIGK